MEPVLVGGQEPSVLYCIMTMPARMVNSLFLAGRGESPHGPDSFADWFVAHEVFMIFPRHCGSSIHDRPGFSLKEERPMLPSRFMPKALEVADEKRSGTLGLSGAWPGR